MMVDAQLIPRGISDSRVLEAMRNVPRHLFVPESMKDSAYADMAMAIGENQTISQPYMVAIMTELLGLAGDEKVLEIGTGSGYQAALLAALAKEVHTIERIAALSERAADKFRELGIENISTHIGDGTLGLAEYAPFDRIIITAATPEIPAPLLGQLKDGGFIVVPVGERFSQTLIKGTKTDKMLLKEYHTACVFVPLIGEFGWKGQ
ncbi:MAG: protein-L-isoaspartate(D-aspartate) O-methyltransferase [Nitrospirae bacterium]|nr:protein-L-isoaspartate(D-aspartate) O-methyltransferase [Nitrospirota bacterium]